MQERITLITWLVPSVQQTTVHGSQCLVGPGGIGAAGPHSPADVTVLSLLSWFPRRPAWAWPISQIAAGAQLRSDRLGNNVEENNCRAESQRPFL